ncbi:hypothetical protein BV25DRAFT_969872 [Artomyces pyxidatus]|uniref:Uncharacterized protein n=1 Tax=Artomyces pyxidatus TaxID=48021 RepID=A0ACB8SVM4_9AGAM|nr:hypothetical protein BV25DRAFT_969872 [Artomyces pyxidatus]
MRLDVASQNGEIDFGAGRSESLTPASTFKAFCTLVPLPPLLASQHLSRSSRKNSPRSLAESSGSPGRSGTTTHPAAASGDFNLLASRALGGSEAGTTRPLVTRVARWRVAGRPRQVPHRDLQVLLPRELIPRRALRVSLIPFSRGAPNCCNTPTRWSAQNYI